MRKPQKNNPTGDLYYLYDREADVLYLSQGKPSSRDFTMEADNDVLLRISRRDGSVRGLTILNVSKQSARRNKPVRLPVKTYWTQGATVHPRHAHL